jgi:hypothetical protein
VLAWKGKSHEQLRRAVATGMENGGRAVAAQVQRNVEGKLNIRRRGFVKTYRYRVYAKQVDRMPSLTIGTRIPFSGILEHGGTVRARGKLMLIPFGNVRVGPKTFRRMIQNLMSRGEGYFRQVNGRLLLFAENRAENSREIGRFKRGARAAAGGKLKRGGDVPIAVAVPEVHVSKRTDVFGTVRRGLSAIVESIETEVRRGIDGR